MRIVRLTFSLTILAVLASPASAQRQRQQGTLITNKSVQEELKLSDEQVKKATDLDKAIGEKRREEMGKLTDEERRGDKGRELTQKFNAELTAELKKILKSEQQTRYQEIEFQQSVSRALSGGGRRGSSGTQRALYEIKPVADGLKFSDDQKEKLKAVSEECRKKCADARQDAGNDRAKSREATARIVAETLESIQKVLTPDQKKKWQELSGKPFTVRRDRPGTDL